MKFMRIITVFVILVSVAQAEAAESPDERARELQQRDQLRIAVQEICPISGEKLGSMGEPIKVQVGQETIFLCCKGCLKQKIKPDHWATIHMNVAKAQGICPVMKHELPKKPKWIIVEGQIVYVCCPPCTKKIAADPELYLRAVDELYTAAIESRKRVQQR